jgi:hypothetical protein
VSDVCSTEQGRRASTSVDLPSSLCKLRLHGWISQQDVDPTLPSPHPSAVHHLPCFAAANARGLLQSGGFPYCRCLDYSPSSSPYFLTGPNVTPLEGGAINVCFSLQTTPSSIANTSAPCYQQLASSLHKIAFETSYTCFNNRAFYNVTVNGNTQHFDVSAQNACFSMGSCRGSRKLLLPACLSCQHPQ